MATQRRQTRAAADGRRIQDLPVFRIEPPIIGKLPYTSRTMLQVVPGIEVDERELQERFVRASGPGGQNVNKVATAVELRFDVKASSLPEDLKQRLVTLAGRRMTAEGVLVIDSRVHRSQLQNREAARERLLDLLRTASHKPRPRRKTRPSKSAKEKRLVAKVSRARIKKGRERVRPED
jgi:ribosome-associated protein